MRIVLILLLISSNGFSQNITLQGALPKENLDQNLGQITVFSTKDSTLKKGSYIDSTFFELSFKGSINQAYYAKIKLPGFADTIINFTPTSPVHNLGLIQLEPDLTLGSVEVIYREPAFVRTMDGIQINVSGTTLQQLTNLFEILKASPKLTSPDDERIEIIGKGVPLILIDRQPILSNDELKAIPAEMVDKIEIITNPSAKYKAQGRGSGVIEVYTKDFSLEGFNVTLSGAGGVNTQLKPSSDGNIGLSLKKRKFSLNANIGVNYNTQFSNGESLTSTTDSSNRETAIDYYGDSFNTSSHVNVKSAYRINEKQKITLGVRGYGNKHRSDNYSSSDYYNNDTLFSQNNTRSTNGYTWLNGSSFINYLLETDTNNSALEININYKLKVDEGSATSRNEFVNLNNGNLTNFNIQSNSKNRPNVGEMRVSYEHVFDTTGWKLSGGGSYSLVYNGKKFNQYNLIDDTWTIDANFTNSYNYVEQNGSVFTEFSKKWKKISVRGGLTGEYTNLNGYSNSLEKQFIDSSYFLLFPSASIMLEPNEKVGLTFYYSSGIDRPQFSNYDPFVRKEDSLSITYGNPYLRPEIRQNFGVNLDLFYQYSLSVDYSVAKNSESSLSFIDENTFLVNTTPWNSERSQSLSVSLNIPLKASWFNGWNSVWMNYNKYEFTPIFEREDFYNLTYGLWSYSNFFLPKNFTITNRLYFGRWGGDGSRSKVQMHWGMRMTKKMMDNKFQIYLDVDNIAPPINRFESFSGNYIVVSRSQWSFTTFKLGVYYKFGRLKQDTHIKETESGESNRI